MPLVSGAADANQKDPVVSLRINEDGKTIDAIVLDVASIQQKLHRRMTRNIAKRQLAYILGETEKVFGVKADKLE